MFNWILASAGAAMLGLAAEDAFAGEASVKGNEAAVAGQEAQDLLDPIAAWLSAQFGLPAGFEHPRIVIVPPEDLARLRHGAMGRSGANGLVAVYMDRESAIYVAKEWDLRTPAGASVLVHEMVHHLQHLAGKRFACPGEREAMAYAAQERWLAQFGGSLESEFGVDAFTLLARTACVF